MFYADSINRLNFRQVLDCASPLALLREYRNAKAAEGRRSPGRCRVDASSLRFRAFHVVSCCFNRRTRHLMRRVSVHTRISPAERAEPGFDAFNQPEGETTLTPAGLPADGAVRANAGQSLVKRGQGHVDGRIICTIGCFAQPVVVAVNGLTMEGGFPTRCIPSSRCFAAPSVVVPNSPAREIHPASVMAFCHGWPSRTQGMC